MSGKSPFRQMADDHRSVLRVIRQVADISTDAWGWVEDLRLTEHTGACSGVTTFGMLARSPSRGSRCQSDGLGRFFCSFQLQLL